MNKAQPKYIIPEYKFMEAIKDRKIVHKLPGKGFSRKSSRFRRWPFGMAVENLVAAHVLYKISARGTYVRQRKTLKDTIWNISYFFESRIAWSRSNQAVFRISHRYRIHSLQDQSQTWISQKPEEKISRKAQFRF